MVRSLVLLSAVALVSGCLQLSAERPLLDPATRVGALGEGALLLRRFPPDGPDAPPRYADPGIMAVGLERAGDVYRSSFDGLFPKGSAVSFHDAFPGLGAFAVETPDAAAGAPERVTYALAEIEDDTLFAYPIVLSGRAEADAKALIAARGGGRVKSGAILVETPETLAALTAIWARQAKSGERLRRADALRFDIFRESGAAAAALAEARRQDCLGRAGHPDWPELWALPGKLSRGVALDEIKADKAVEACGHAAETLAPAESAQALLRALWTDDARLAEAKALMERALEADLPHAHVMMAEALVTGRLADQGIARDPQAAIAWLDRHAARHPRLLAAKAHYLAMEEPSLGWPDHAGSAAALRAAAATGDAASRAYLADALMRGRPGIEQDQAAAIAEYGAAAASGMPRASFELGKAYYFGTGVEKDLARAMSHLETAARQSHDGAQYFLGFMLAHGQGIDKPDPGQGRVWLDRAADLGNASARIELGRMVALGLGGPKDREKGVKLIARAREQDPARAERYLAEIERSLHPVYRFFLARGTVDETDDGGRERRVSEVFTFSQRLKVRIARDETMCNLVLDDVIEIDGKDEAGADAKVFNFRTDRVAHFVDVNCDGSGTLYAGSGSDRAEFRTQALPDATAGVDAALAGYRQGGAAAVSRHLAMRLSQLRPTLARIALDRGDEPGEADFSIWVEAGKNTQHRLSVWFKAERSTCSVMAIRPEPDGTLTAALFPPQPPSKYVRFSDEGCDGVIDSAGLSAGSIRLGAEGYMINGKWIAATVERLGTDLEIIPVLDTTIAFLRR